MQFQRISILPQRRDSNFLGVGVGVGVGLDFQPFWKSGCLCVGQGTRAHKTAGICRTIKFKEKYQV